MKKASLQLTLTIEEAQDLKQLAENGFKDYYEAEGEAWVEENFRAGGIALSKLEKALRKAQVVRKP